MTMVLRVRFTFFIHLATVFMMLFGPWSGSIPVSAQSSTCTAEMEPNNTESDAQDVASAFCILGTLPETSDQDLFLWTVSDDDAKFGWSLSVDGPDQTMTTAHILAIDSESGVEPVVAGSELLQVSHTPTDLDPVARPFLISAGTYLVGISRTDRADFTAPADASYVLDLSRTDRLPKRADKEPNDDPATATQIAGAFEVSGDMAGSWDVFAWTLTDEDAASGWELEVNAPINQSLSYSISRADTGEVLTSSYDQVHQVLYDLALAPGTYWIQITTSSEAAARYTLSARPVQRPESDLEPNDTPAGASPIDVSQPVLKGRLGTQGDVDQYRLTVDDALAGSLFDIRVISRQEIERKVCLASVETGYDLQCKSGPGGATISTLLLPKGTYLIRISGDPDPDAQYVLRVDITTPPSPAFETEPNDDALLPAELDPATPMQGSFDGDEWDVFHFVTTGEPQLWDVSITGTGISQLDLTQADGTELATALISDGSGGTIYDLYLTPGDHWIRTSGLNGAYTITLTANGPPPDDGEHETNNAELTSEPLLLGQSKSGRLADPTDVDFFRFSLAAREHIAVRLRLPDDASHRMTIYQGGETLYQGSPDAPGDTLSADLILEPGDYIIRIDTSAPSLGRYQLSTKREDPFVVADDQEPNDSAETAQSIQTGQTVSGQLNNGDPADYYALPPDLSGSIEFSLAGDGVYPALSDGDLTYQVEQDSDGTWSNAERVPRDIPLFIVLTGTGAYDLTFGAPSDGGAGGIFSKPSIGGGDQAPTLDMSVAFDHSEVAAYWEQQQSITGTLTLANTGDEPLSGTLQAVTSHYAWTVDLDQDQLSLEPGATVSFPVTVQIEPDAWANVPVRITIGAFVGASNPVTAFFEITPTASAPPVNPETSWPVPDAMLGGLNLAATALGATPAGTLDLAQEAFLYDGVSPVGATFSISSPVLPLEVTTDLAGDAPASIAGFMINNQANDGLRQSQARHVEFQLSGDGVSFETVLTAELSPIVRDQYFVLESPVDAVAARLRILDSYHPDYPTQPTYISIGEFAVVADPGFVPSFDKGINLADPALGGHVVRISPQQTDPNAFVGMLDADLATSWSFAGGADGSSISWVIGFGNNRAAQFSKIGWKERDAWNPDSEAVINAVTVEVAVDSLNGPWTTIATWNLRRNENGDARSFTPDAPVWARYIRFTATIDTTYGLYAFMPGQLTVTEAPLSSDYHSAVGAYGSTNKNGPYEVAYPIEYGTLDDPNDAPDDQAQAAELALNETVDGVAQIGADVDWYKVTVPDGDNTLTFDLTGNPQVDVVVRVYDPAGTEVPAERAINGSTDSITYTAPAEPGTTYTVRVEQPPHAIIFTFDTSISIGPYLPLVMQSVRAFAGGVQAGQEFVNVIPFAEQPLMETWTDDSYVVYSALAGYVELSLSSSAEQALLDSSTLLADQEGTTAVLIETDAETSSFDKSEEMWNLLSTVQPRVFAVHVGGSTAPIVDKNLMQDWASFGGYYQYVNTQVDMDRAFDRAATWLRRPTAYSLTVRSEFVEPVTPTPEPTAAPEEPAEPGTIVVNAPTGSTGAGDSSTQISDQVTVEIILDTSGSMLGGLPDGQRRIDAARGVLSDLVQNQLPAGIPVTLRVFGNQPDSCDTSQLVPLGPLDPLAMSQTIQAIEPVNLVRTPIGEALKQVANDLAGVSGPKVVILVTDGEETCDGDPAAAIRDLRAQGFDVQINIVGFALDDDALRQQFKDWAALGGGTYADAGNADELADAIARASQAPFRVLDANGEVVATGTVGGEPVDLPPGTYTVEVLTDPVQTFEQVVVDEGKPTTIDLPGT